MNQADMKNEKKDESRGEKNHAQQTRQRQGEPWDEK